MRTCAMPFIMVVGMFVVVGIVMTVATLLLGVFIIVLTRLVLCESFGRNGPRVGFLPCTARARYNMLSPLKRAACARHADTGVRGSVGESQEMYLETSGCLKCGLAVIARRRHCPSSLSCCPAA